MAKTAKPKKQEYIVSKSSSLLDFFGAEGDTVDYAKKLEDMDATHLRRIRITRALWEELRKPDQITVTIEPGDQLNQGA